MERHRQFEQRAQGHAAHVHEHEGDEQAVEEFFAAELFAVEHIARHAAHHQGDDHNAQTDEDAVLGVGGKIGLFPCLDVVFDDEMGGHGVGAATQQLRIFLEGAQHDIHDRVQDQHRHKRQEQKDKSAYHPLGS